MGQDDGNAEEAQKSPKSAGYAVHHGQKLTMLPLIALIFYGVSGGPFGVEDSVKAGGPLLAILGFVIFPIIWSVPEALITAELATAFPENGGYVVWVSAAFGRFWGFQQGWYKWLSGVIDNALYPVLFLDYLKRALPIFEEGLVRNVSLVAITFLLTYLNYRGLTIVGFSAVLLTAFSLLPFLLLAVLSLPKIQPRRWLVVDLKTVEWTGYLNTLFWNLNYWDSISTLAGEVEKPKQNFPTALTGAVVLVVLGYLIPLLAGTGALELNQAAWEDGYFADVAMAVGGLSLKWWVEAAAAFSNVGLFWAEMSSDAFQLQGMGERGMLPQVFSMRSKYGTPMLGILCSATGVLLLSSLSFQEIVELLNYLYCLGMLLEFAAYIWLRIKFPDMPRPYQVPLGNVGVTLMCVPASIVLVVVMCIASWKTVIFSLVIVIIGVVAHPALEYMKAERWFKFAVSPDLPDLDPQNQEGPSSLRQDTEAEAHLLGVQE